MQDLLGLQPVSLPETLLLLMLALVLVGVMELFKAVRNRQESQGE